jgi:hypothetical protein
MQRLPAACCWWSDHKAVTAGSKILSMKLRPHSSDEGDSVCCTHQLRSPATNKEPFLCPFTQHQSQNKNRVSDFLLQHHFKSMQYLLLILLLLVDVSSTEMLASTSNNTKLVALFHAGPGKTGTTHLQASLVQSEDKLLKHNFSVWPDLYPAFQKCKIDGLLPPSAGMINMREKTLAFYHTYFEICPSIQRLVLQFIQKSAKLKQNVIFSSETFLSYSPAVKSIMDMLAAEDYQIHGVMVYRFPLSWFISRYGEAIKTSSITSKENIPSHQHCAPLLSDYLSTHWKKYFKPHQMQDFSKGLSTYPDYRLSIVDLYGSNAAKKDLNYVFLCEIAGILCDESEMFEELKSLQLHDSEPQAVITERQMGFLFAEFALQRNCTMVFSEKKSKAREFLRKILNRHKWKEPIPVRAVNISEYANLSLEIDRNCRSEYGKYFVNGNAEANALKVQPLPVVMEVDREAALGKQWRQEMRSHLRTARKKGLCIITTNEKVGQYRT